MAAKDSSLLCCVCGKPCEEGADTSRTAHGKVVSGKFEEKKESGVMHRSCHNRAFNSPTATIDELERQARSSSR